MIDNWETQGIPVFLIKILHFFLGYAEAPFGRSFDVMTPVEQ